MTVMTIRHPLFRDLWKHNLDVDEVLFSSLHSNPRYGHPSFWLHDYWVIRRDIRQAVKTYGFTEVYFVKMFLTPAKVYAHLPFRRYREHKVFHIAHELGVTVADPRYTLKYGDDDRRWARDFLKQHNLDKDIVVGLHFRGSSANKSLPRESQKRIIHSLRSLGYQLVLFDSAEGRKSYHPSPDVAPCFSDSILHAAALIGQCAFLVCVDSGAGHIAAALNKPLFSIYFRDVWMQNSLALGDSVHPYLYTGDVDTLVERIKNFAQQSRSL